MKSFEELGLNERILQAIGEQGYEYPMPIQEAVIPVLLGNKDENGWQGDLVALAQTGTGKTAAYGLPIVQLTEGAPLHPVSLILAPTRELCLQIADDLEGFSKHSEGVHILPVYGGTSIEAQIRALRRGINVLVATPGRLIDLMKRGVADLSTVRNVVLDEADEMLTMGFQEDLNEILGGIPEEHRTLLFSATMSKEIEAIARQYLKDSKEIQVGSRNEGAEHVNHIYYMVRAQDKYHALKRVVDYYPRIYGIVFCRTRMETQEIADKLIQDGYNADALHGDLSQQQRDLTMQKFRQHRTQLLVATDVAARGLDVNDLTHVINYGLPDDTENYTHRSGRTGRAGKKGTSISIVHVREKGKIRIIEKAIQKQFERGTLPSGKDICQKQLYRVIDDIERVDVMEEEIADVMPEVSRRWEWLDKEELIKRIVSREFGRFLAYYADAPEIEEVQEGKGGTGTERSKRGGKGGPRQAEEGYTRLFLNVGKIDGFYAKEVIGLINRTTKGMQVEIGKIDLMKSFTFVEVAAEQAQDVIKSMKHGVTIKGRSVVCDVADKSEEEKITRHGKKRDRKPEQRSSKPSAKGGSRAKQDGKPARAPKAQPQQHHYTKDDWMKFLHPETSPLKGEMPDFAEEGWARRKPKKKKG
ncbi:MAG: DEAD/DEAH box helicase [Bacteroidaceae bacterium]|jgi:ATP-dependent RNA helicase DeaD|nr:DEAD/DEAH box helicase [Bacteroidaceae bacterium]MBQ5655393.1 DEAD/DEAH box helicase [Bacteroidaceae bacterium]